MPSKYENMNIYIYLAEKGWTYEEIADFFSFLEMHVPKQEEVDKALKKIKENSQKKDSL